MDTLFSAVLWIVAIVGGFLLLDTVLGISSGQIAGMVAVILCSGVHNSGLAPVVYVV